MEKRRTIYYSGNTVDPPTIDPADLKERRKWHPRHKMGPDLPVPHGSLKVFATARCVWCMKTFDGYRVICPRCQLCQFCGLLVGAQAECRFCGNTPDEHLRETLVHRVIRIA
jgi:hypothetical protein